MKEEIDVEEFLTILMPPKVKVHQKVSCKTKYKNIWRSFAKVKAGQAKNDQNSKILQHACVSISGSRQIESWTVGSRAPIVRLWQLGLGQSGPNVRGPVVRLEKLDNWAPGPNLPGIGKKLQKRQKLKSVAFTGCFIWRLVLLTSRQGSLLKLRSLLSKLNRRSLLHCCQKKGFGVVRSKDRRAWGDDWGGGTLARRLPLHCNQPSASVTNTQCTKS